MKLIDVPVSNILVDARMRTDDGDLDGLMASIERVGLLHPLVLNSRYELIAGCRRLRAVVQLGWDSVPCVVAESLDDALQALQAELDENTCRKQMTPTEIVHGARRIEDLAQEQAKERQRLGGRAGGQASGNLPEASDSGRARDRVASAFGVSGRTYEKAKQVVEAAESDPDRFGDLPEQMDETSVDAAYKEMKRRREAVAQPDDQFAHLDGANQDDPPVVGMTPAQVAAIDDIEQSSRNYDPFGYNEDDLDIDEADDEEDGFDDDDWHAPVPGAPTGLDDDDEEMKAHEAELDRIEAAYLAEKAAEREVEDRRDRERRAAEREAVRRKALEDLAAQAPESDAWEVRLGDCASGMHEGLHGIARLVFADPPYNIGWDYGDGRQADMIAPHHFMTWAKGWLEQIPKVLTADGSFWLLINDEYAAEMKVAAEDAGLYLRQWLIWYESFGAYRGSKFSRTHRHLLHFVQDESDFVFNESALEVRRPSYRAEHGDSRAAAETKIWDSVWGINPQIPRVCGTHKEAIPGSPAPQLPLALLKPIIAVASDPGDLVIDPFVGNATTGVAALQMGRRFLGWELRKPIHDIATLRLKATVAQLAGGIS